MFGLILCLTLVQAPGSESLLADYSKVVVMPLSGFGSTEEALNATQNILLRELRGILGDALISPDKWRSEGKSLKRALSKCDGAIGCLLEIFGSLGYDGLIVGTMSGIGTERAITLKLYELRSGKEARQSSEKASGEKEELIRQIRKAAVRLLAPDRFRGTLEVVSNQPGIQILIDGVLVATTPLRDSKIPLAVGTHSVEARGERLVPFEAMIDVAYEEVKELVIDLPRNNLFVGGNTPYYARWWTWVIVGVGVAASAGGGALYVDYTNRQNEFAQNVAANRRSEVEALAENTNRLYGSWALFGGGGAALGSASGLLISDIVKLAKGRNQRNKKVKP